MLSRKGTLSRKTRASIRRHHAAAHHHTLGSQSLPRGHQLAGTARTTCLATTGVPSTRRCSVPNLNSLDIRVTSLPCRSDTNLASRLSGSSPKLSAGRAESKSPTARGMPGCQAAAPSAAVIGINGGNDPSGGASLRYGLTPNGVSIGGSPALPSPASPLLWPPGSTSGHAPCESSPTWSRVSSIRGSTALSGSVVGASTAVLDDVHAGTSLCRSVSWKPMPTPPPSEKALYESTVVWTDVDDPDQTFSLLGSLCEAGVETNNPCDFIFRAFFILSGTWPVTVFLVGLLALPLVMTTIGVNYLHDCPVEPKLPIYLVVGGCFGIIKLLFLLWKQIKRHKEDMGDLHDDEDLLTMTRMTNIALNIFLCVWFAFGHYWVFHIWKPHFTAPLHEPRNWCDETVFTFSFWQLVICHAVLGFVLTLSFIMCCCFVCVKCLIADAKR